MVNAQAMMLAGDPVGAHTRALSVLESCREELVGVEALIVLGQVAWSTGQREEAQVWYRRAIASLTGVGADREAAQVWFEIGTLAAQAGLVAESADAFRRAAVSAGLTSRLPVIDTPAAAPPRTVPDRVPAGRMPVIAPPASVPRTTPPQSPHRRV